MMQTLRTLRNNESGILQTFPLGYVLQILKTHFLDIYSLVLAFKEFFCVFRSAYLHFDYAYLKILES